MYSRTYYDIEVQWYFPVFKKIMNVLYNLLGVWKINYKFGTITYVLHTT